MLIKTVLSLLIFFSLSIADEFDDEFSDGFEDETQDIAIEEIEKKAYYVIGNLEQKVNFATHNSSSHNDINSIKSSLYLETEYNFNENHKLRASVNGFYDSIYDVKSSRAYTQAEKDELRSEVEIFDLYLQGKITSKLDYKIGRQVVVWGRSDTIRVTDILNPLDNRSPGIVDIEDLRLPTGMVKFDYYFSNWNVSAIIIGETRYSKNPVYGSDFYPFNSPAPNEEINNKPSFALSVNGNFSSWDISLYAAKTTSDVGHIEILAGEAILKHENVSMFGYALNYIYDSWLFKTEAAYFDGHKYRSTGDKTFSKMDMLVGLEYNGIAETVIAFEAANQHINDYDDILALGTIPTLKNTTQYAFRINSDFLNATLKANYLVSLFGEDMSDGGFQRVWFDYDLSDSTSATVGYVDYISGSTLFDIIDDNDMLFTSVKYSF